LDSRDDHGHEAVYFLTVMAIVFGTILLFSAAMEMLGVLLASGLAIGYGLLLVEEIRIVDVSRVANERASRGFVIIWVLSEVMLALFGPFGSSILNETAVILWLLAILLYPVSILGGKMFRGVTVPLLAVGAGAMIFVRFAVFPFNVEAWFLACLVFVMGMAAGSADMKPKRFRPSARRETIRETVTKETVLVICPHCGHKNEIGTRFCGKCGASI